MKIKVLISLFAIYLLSGCQLLPENARLQVYRVAVQQGNVVDIEKRQKLVAKKYKFKIQDHSLVLYGEFEDE